MKTYYFFQNYFHRAMEEKLPCVYYKSDGDTDRTFPCVISSESEEFV